MMTTYAVSRPWGNGATVSYTTRLVIEDVPDDVTVDEIADWLDDHDQQLDHITPQDEWGPSVQLSAQDAPRVRWRGRPGRPEVGPMISVRLDPDLLAAVDADAERAGQSRAAAIRRLLRSALA